MGLYDTGSVKHPKIDIKKYPEHIFEPFINY